MDTNWRTRAERAHRTPTVIAGALGECVHVAGVLNFLRLAEASGCRTVFLGPAVSISDLVGAIQETDADLVGVSYRLTPETGLSLLHELKSALLEAGLTGRGFCFGGTPPVAALARELGLFDAVFTGDETPEEMLAYLRGRAPGALGEEDYPQTTVERLAWKAPRPLLRHHFGLPDLEATQSGIERIAEARVLDVISLGTDQDAQEHFFHPERQDPRRRGAGGVPVRSADDYRALYRASRRGNYPLLRTYAGTDDLLELAQVYVETIQNAWCAVPIFWFNQMDRRGPLGLEESIRLHQALMAWHGERGIPVEANEAHHWGLRDAHDTVFVVASYLGAYNARAAGVADYIAPYMLNSPPVTSDRMDLAKMLAARDLVESLCGPGFRVYRQTRTGLLSYPVDVDAARGQLAASVYLQMALEPHIVHVVGYCEADHAARPEEVIASCRIAQRAIDNALAGQPAMACDERVTERRQELRAEAQVLLEAIARLAGPDVEDPLTDPATLARAVTVGLLDAPHLVGSGFAPGRVVTRVVDGACRAVDPHTGRPWTEAERLRSLAA